MVKTAVIFSLIPSLERFSIAFPKKYPLVFVTGIFTYTLLPHEDMYLACLIISSFSSAKISKLIGFSVTIFKIFFANFS